MATMIPGAETRDDFNDSPGELKMYDSFKELPNDYYFFHSTQWNEVRKKEEMSAKIYRRLQWGECDFIIFHPRRGFLFVEVKGGDIFTDGAGNIIQENRATFSQKKIRPLRQAQNSRSHFNEIFDKKFDDSFPYSNRFECAVWFPDCNHENMFGNAPQDYKKEIVLWARDAETPIAAKQAIDRLFDFYGFTPISAKEELTEDIVDTIAPEFGCFRGIRSQAIAEANLFLRMTEEQKYLLDYLEEQECAAINGVAGTGKTCLAQNKADRLGETGDRVILLCFNKLLKEHLQKEKHNKNVDIYNIDGLYTSYVRRPTSEDRKVRANELFEFLADWETFKLPYKHIIVDEGQDFPDIVLLQLKEIAEKNKGCFYVFYDRNQAGQVEEYPESIDEMECRLVLTRNCRNTKEIALTSTRPINIAEEKIKTRRENAFDYLHPDKPFLFVAKDATDVADKTAKLIQKYLSGGIKPDNIVVLSCKGFGKSALDSSSLHLEGGRKLVQERNGKDILFSTAFRFKGLEASAIIFIDVDSSTFQSEKSRNEFYIGTSRARSFLNIITTDSAAEIASTILGERVTGPKAMKALSDALKVKIATDSDLTE